MINGLSKHVVALHYILILHFQEFVWLRILELLIWQPCNKRLDILYLNLKNLGQLSEEF